MLPLLLRWHKITHWKHLAQCLLHSEHPLSLSTHHQYYCLGMVIIRNKNEPGLFSFSSFFRCGNSEIKQPKSQRKESGPKFEAGQSWLLSGGRIHLWVPSREAASEQGRWGLWPAGASEGDHQAFEKPLVLSTLPCLWCNFQKFPEVSCCPGMMHFQDEFKL